MHTLKDRPGQRARLRAFFALGLALALGLPHLPVISNAADQRKAPEGRGNFNADSATPASERAAEESAGAAYGNLPLSFEANRGQTDRKVQFLARTGGYSLFLTSTEAVLSLSGNAADEPRAEAGAARGREPKREANSHAVLRIKMVASNPAAAAAGLDELPGKVSYYVGSKPEDWHTNIPTFARVQYTEVYPGIDLVYYGNGGQLEYDYVVAPGADPADIRLAFEGATKMSINGEGDLVLDTEGGQVVQHAPTVYQEIEGARKVVASRYVLGGKNEVGFEVGAYDDALPLVIDPTLTYSTFLGGNDYDYAYDIAVDTAGNAYVTGQTDSTNFPQAPSPRPGNIDAFVTKFNAAGTALIYSIYLGGSDREGGGGDEKYGGIAVDSSGNAYVTGLTWSQDFPVKNPFQEKRNGYGRDAFVTKFGPTGVILYSTYFGGTDNDECDAIAVDSARNIYIVGRTYSDDLKTHNAYQATNQGNRDIFLTKFNAAGSALLYSTYFGTENYESEPVSVAVDSAGNAYVASSTNSDAFPTTANAYRRQPNSYQNDAVVAKFLTTATGAASLVYSSFLGGSSSEKAYEIAADASGNAYVTGETYSDDFPTKNAFQSAYGGWGDAFLTKLNTKPAACTQTATDNCRESLLYSTYLGGNNDRDAGLGLAADINGNAYVTGSTQSKDFPVRSAIQATKTNYSWDVFVTKLNTKAVGSASLVHSTFLLGTYSDRGRAIALDTAFNMYVTGNTESSDFLKKNPYQPTKGNYSDAFVTKISDQANLVSLTVTPSTVLGSKPATGKVTLTAPAPAVGAKVTLTDTLAGATVPTSVTIPAGATYKTFTITTTLVSTLQSGTVSANYNGITKSVAFKVRPIGVASLTATPNPVVGPNKATGTVTLELPAAPGNITVTLSSNNPSVASPAVTSIVIPAGVKSKTFTVNTADVLSPGSATLKATANGVFKTFLLKVN